MAPINKKIETRTSLIKTQEPGNPNMKLYLRMMLALTSKLMTLSIYLRTERFRNKARSAVKIGIAVNYTNDRLKVIH